MARYLTQRWVVHDSRFLKTKTRSNRGNVSLTDCCFDRALANRAFSKAKALYHRPCLVPDRDKMGYPKGDRPKHGPQDNTKIRSCQSFFSRKHCHPRRSSLRYHGTPGDPVVQASLTRQRLIQNSLVVFHPSLIPNALWLLQSTLKQ